MTWTPTESFLRGKIIKPFLPYEKHPNLHNSSLKNLYPGDEIYVFETKNDRWARGYALSKPFPNDFTITSVNLDELPGVNINVVVFPLKYFKIVEPVAITDIKVSKNFNNITNIDAVPTLQDSEKARKIAIDGNVGDTRPLAPVLPMDNFEQGEDLVGEIRHALGLLTSHIFALYSIGEFRLFNKLSSIYYDLNETRIKLTHNLLTIDETQVAKETATFLLNKIPKKLASRAARLNAQSYDLDNHNTDISGYKAILSRETTSGELLANSVTFPSKIALNQVLCALASNFPINAHQHIEEFSLEPAPNKKLHHEPPSHILVDFKSVSGSSAYQPPGFAGMIAYLYIRNNRKRLTEAFAVHTNSVDDLVHVEKISAALFRNIPSSEIENSRVYLVAVLTEEIDLSVKTNNVPLVKRVKKGVAAGVTDITRIFSRNQGSLQSGESHQFSIKLFGSYVNNKKGPKMEDQDPVVNNGWGELVDRIISGSSHGVVVNPRAEKLIVSIKEFKHQFAGVNQNPISTSAPISRIKPIFFDPLAENYERIYLAMGKVSLLNSITKDDLLTFEVSTPNNELITFAKASNQQEKRNWQFVSVFPDESVGEIIKINGVSLKNPSKKFPKDDHIVLSLYVNGVLAGEGKLLYKSGNRLVEFNKRKTHTIEIISTTHNIPMAQVDLSTEYVGKIYNSDSSIDNIFQFERFFRSGSKGIDELSASLVSFCKLDISQLVKYFPELLSSLYSIVDYSFQQGLSSSIEILHDNTFKAIVHLLDIVFGKQDQYLYLIDTFVERYSNLPLIGIFLLNKMSEIFSRAESNWNSMSRSLCRVVALVMKLAVHSINASSDFDAYFKALSSLFKSGAFFLSIQSNSLVNDQVLILDIIDYVLTFQSYLNVLDLLKFIVSFIDTIGIRGLGANEEAFNNKKSSVSNQKDHKIIVSKLLLIRRLFSSSIVEDAASRRLLISKSVGWVMEVLLGPTDIDASRLACSVLNSVCTLLWKTIVLEGKEEEIDLCYSLTKLLPAISRTIIKYNKFTRGNDFFKPKRTFTQLFPTEYPFKEASIDPIVNDEVLVEILVELSSIFCFIARIGKATAGSEGFSKILSLDIPNDFFDPSKYLASDFRNEDLITLISGVKLMRQGKFFPEDKWLSLYGVIIDGCLASLELIRPLLINHYIPSISESEVFDRVLWGNYLKTLLRLAVLAPVSIEHLSDVPRKACFQITGTVRDRAAFLVNEAWDSLAWDATSEDIIRFNLNKFGGYQVEFINQDYGILQDLMLFALQKNAACQSVSVKILWSIMISEYILSDNIVDIEKECLVGLHEIYNRNSYKPSLVEQDMFIERMKLTIRLDREDEAYGMITNFIESVSGFLFVLNDLNSVPVGPEFDDDRTFHKLNINAYLKNANKPELFHSFINSMYEENISKNDHIQAALSLELLASTYTWDHNTIIPSSFRPKFPEQSSFERKETLYKMIATNYIKGNSLERATDTYNELLDSYSNHTYDLKSFAYVHNKLAKLYLDLESSDKLSPSFFRVSFIGAGFPTNIRGKEQIYEGLPFEHITSIHERLLRLYPGARIISDDVEAKNLKDKVQTGRYLHVSTVEPVNEISDKLFNTSIGVRQYARNKDLRFFTSLKKIPGSTSVFDLWTEETTYETHLSFPTLMNRSDIKSVKVIKLSPLDNAIRTIVTKNNDLIQLESMINMAIKEKTDHTSLLNDLSRQLAGTVDSPVNGGVGQYRTFFTDSKYDGNGDYVDEIRLLRKAFDDLAMILNRALHLHGKLVTNTLKASHEVLVELYKKNFKEDIEKLKINTDYETLNHAPVSHYQQSINDKRSISGISGTAPSITGSRLTRTTSRGSSASSVSASERREPH
ncbi:dedicator of cytokinesis protein 4 CRK binding protein [Suhomyces tanzawaensis NRRL Y-17324]|uniref:Dedicator of cytokinesis protein 4 CRK binding protein n=1 Tax=Suhomyces tanzawaensis NRRL Y-17324 TaxID=984487 RepID=A0A1E4SK17_9ASCO|nr:dedicator of cytokinesis protein 4 CRK binding protein [Suhomyces tanzawaensis NRRL Y-17324]ODV79777.1 dedicator of cytokinesis protein 4 CRK binding protein [Suhomyces tanzawaensis NRRL Y-17324]